MLQLSTKNGKSLHESEKKEAIKRPIHYFLHVITVIDSIIISTLES